MKFNVTELKNKAAQLANDAELRTRAAEFQLTAERASREQMFEAGWNACAKLYRDDAGALDYLDALKVALASDGTTGAE